MDVEIVSTEVIKPSVPTPHHLTTYTFSLLDQIADSFYVPILLFYPATSCGQSPASANPQDRSMEMEMIISAKLKKSLSETLTRYYPFAGTIKDSISIDCDDEGVVFVEVRINKKIVDVLREPESKMMSMLFPDDLPWKRPANYRSVLAVKLSFFLCGGFAIAVCISHKIADACTVFTFLKDWAASAHAMDGVNKTLSPVPQPPQLIAASVFPPNLQLALPDRKPPVEGQNVMISRRFVFHPAKIAALKAVIDSNSSPQMQVPTRVEAVTAWIYKHASNASKAASSGVWKPSRLTQMVNLRRRMEPPLPENSVGNMIWFFAVAIKEENDAKLDSLVHQMRKGLEQVCNLAKELEGDRLFLIISEMISRSASRPSGSGEKYTCGSWCGFGAYEVDFGWGKPIWLRCADDQNRSIILMDTRCGAGIEAWITLEEEAMAVLECDDEFLEFASLNPSISMD